MRVIGGSFGGRRLKAVEGHLTRPTSDRVREALFSRLEARYGLDGASVLDVFAGTGALAIEALSRGAFRATCIELEKRALDTLRSNLRELGLEERVRVYGDDFKRVLAKLGGEAAPAVASGQRGLSPSRPVDAGRSGGRASVKRRFDGIFLDPPYGKGLALEALAAVARFGLLKPGGWVTLETGRREVTPELVEAAEGSLLTRVREDIYGDTKLALYEEGRPLAETSEGVARIESEEAGKAPAVEVDR